MRLQATMLVSTLVLFCSCMASAQSKKSASDSLLARVSYSVGGYWQVQFRYRPSCFAVYRSGYYQVLGKTKGGTTKTLQGTLSQSRLLELGNMLENLDFKDEAGGIVRGGSERFVAEVVRGDEAVHYVWLNPDHQKPFPSSAARVIDWLQDFDDKDASPLSLHDASDHSICPSLSDSSLQPLTAGLAR